jgi:hypothetical protein
VYRAGCGVQRHNMQRAKATCRLTMMCIDLRARVCRYPSFTCATGCAHVHSLLHLASPAVLLSALSPHQCRQLAENGELKAEVVEETPKSRSEIHYLPRGVVGGITPWNFPIAMAANKILPAVITGNTVVLKPSPYTPLATVMLGEIAQRAFPPGVVNIVTGGDELGRWIVEHPDVSHISFTGSERTGKAIMASAAATLKKLTLELGGLSEPLPHHCRFTLPMVLPS